LFNLIAAFWVGISITKIGLFYLDSRNTIAPDKTHIEKIERLDPAEFKRNGQLHDIYYIILDAYARDDILKDVYHYDNKDFLDYLIKKGFLVAQESMSNYSITRLSIPSSLNFGYIDDLNQIEYGSKNSLMLNSLINNNKILFFLKRHGYLFIDCSPWVFEEISSADVKVGFESLFDEFQLEFMNTTILMRLLVSSTYFYDDYRKKILSMIDTLQSIPDIRAPTFAYFHFPVPHPPFVFGSNGKEVNPKRIFSMRDYDDFLKIGGTREEYLEGYKNQVMFINKIMKETIDVILSKSKTPPIIIIQGDHGPRSPGIGKPIDNLKERFSILNAYYLPDGGDSHLYNKITPVNTFRIVLNHYFGTKYELLEDESYYHKQLDNVFDFINIKEFGYLSNSP
jgi:hypothetical protein